jgi:hypothetical protein
VSAGRERGRVVLTTTALVVLLGLVALAAGGHPLRVGTGHTRGPSATFFDYAWTTLLLVVAAGLVVAVWVILDNVTRLELDARSRRSWLGLPVFLAVATVLAFAVLAAHRGTNRGAAGGAAAFSNPNAGLLARKPMGPTRTARFRWEELAAVLGAVAVATAIALARRRRTTLRLPELRLRREHVGDALDEAVDDLRSELDVRRAVIAAYARTERALAAAGVARHPAEAPFEYLERALAALDASAGSIRRVTELFERAKFSAGDAPPEMREEAIAALLAVRDELRSRRAEPVAA